MIVQNFKDCENIRIDKFPYRGKVHEVKGISVRWLSKCGEDDMGTPEYGLRHFSAEPGGEIPIHNHFYHQTMYILTGHFECWQFDLETNERVFSKVCGPGDAIYIPSMEPHGMKNISDTEPATFLCCIANVYEDEQIILTRQKEGETYETFTYEMVPFFLVFLCGMRVFRLFRQ